MRPDYTTTWLVDNVNEIARYDAGGHTHFKLDYHFVWRTKFNRKILGRVLSPFLVAEILQVAKAKRVKILGLAIAANHVHLCARLRPSHSPADVMMWIKSTTSKNALEEFPAICSRFRIQTLWARGYHVETLGEKNVFSILSYLGRQDGKHDLKSLDCYFKQIDEFLATIPDDEETDERTNSS